MVGWHHRLNGRELEQVLGVGDGQGGLVGCSPWGHKESDTTERRNWTGLDWTGCRQHTVTRHDVLLALSPATEDAYMAKGQGRKLKTRTLTLCYLVRRTVICLCFTSFFHLSIL